MRVSAAKEPPLSASLPVWTPHQISQSHGVENVLRQVALEASLDPETITDLQYSFGVGASLWENQYLVIDTGAYKPTHPDGALHYVVGWLATDPYIETLQRWDDREPFFRKLHQLARAVRGLEPFRYCSHGPIKMVSSRLIDGASYVKRGHLPFPELLFQTWKTSNPARVPQIALWAAYMNYCAYQQMHHRSVFDHPVIGLLSQIRNAISPEKNGGNKWIPLKETLLHMPQLRTPDDVKTHLLRKAQENLTDECWVEISRNIRKLGVAHKPLVYLGSKHVLGGAERLDVIKRFNLDDEDLPGKPLSSLVRLPTEKSTEKNTQPPSAPSSTLNNDLLPDQDETYEENYLALISKKIGSINLEFSQRAVYAENPFLSYKESVDVYQFLSDLSLEKITQNFPRQDQANEYQVSDLQGLAILIWSAVQIGGNLIASASLQINYTPQKGFGLQPDLSGIWRTRAQQQRTTPEVDQEIFFAPIGIEKRSFPDHLAADLKKLWKSDFTHLGRISKISNKSIAKIMKHVGIQLGQSKLDWTSNLLRTFVAKTTDNETRALLLQSNAETNFTSDAAYYSVVNEPEGEPQNQAGSPYYFRLKVFGNYLNKFLTQNYPANNIEAWNLWTDKILTVLSCATGARPVVDLFAEIENFSDDFSLLIIDDKEVVTRDSKRIVHLPKTIASFLRRDYIRSLKELRNTFPTCHQIREGRIQSSPAAFKCLTHFTKF